MTAAPPDHAPPRVVSVNLTDLGPDGESDPVSDRILDIGVAAAKVVSSPPDFLAAQVSLHALRGGLGDGAPHLTELIDAVMRMLFTVERDLGDADAR